MIAEIIDYYYIIGVQLGYWVDIVCNLFTKASMVDFMLDEFISR